MKRNIWLFLLSPLLVLTGVPAHAGSINLTDLLPGTWTLTSTSFVDPLTLGDGTIPGIGIAGSSNLTLTGSDCIDPALPISVSCSFADTSGSGTDLLTFTQFSTVITDATAGDLTFNWNFSTFDIGSFYDPAGYFICFATNDPGTCGPGGGNFQLTMDYNGFDAGIQPGVNVSSIPKSGLGGISDFTTNSAFDSSGNLVTIPLPVSCDLACLAFAESGTVSVPITLSAGDTFGVWVASNNQFGAGQITLSDVGAPTPEPASFLLIGGGLLALGGAGRKARRRRQEEKTTVV